MIKKVKFEIVGISPLLCDRARGGQNKDALPRDQAEGFLYPAKNGRPGFPSCNLYRACIDAGRQIKIGRSNLSTRRTSKIPSMFWLDDDTPPISPGDWEIYTGAIPPMVWLDDDTQPGDSEVCSGAVVIPDVAGILFYRPGFDNWEINFTGSFDTTAVANNVLRRLLEIAGLCVGVGDLSPARNGTFGRFTVKNFEIE